MSKLTVNEFMAEIRKWEADYNDEVYRGRVRRIDINVDLFYQLVTDPVNGHLILPRRGCFELCGIELIPKTEVERWQCIVAK